MGGEAAGCGSGVRRRLRRVRVRSWAWACHAACCVLRAACCVPCCVPCCCAGEAALVAQQRDAAGVELALQRRASAGLEEVRLRAETAEEGWIGTSRVGALVG
jgi:hypothetical protein